MKKYCQICGSKENLCPCKDEEFNETSYMCLKCINEALGFEEPIAQLICPVCHKPFLPKKKKQRICSKVCVGNYVGGMNAKKAAAKKEEHDERS